MTSTQHSRTSQTSRDGGALTVAIYTRSALPEPDALRHVRIERLQRLASEAGWDVSVVVAETRPAGISEAALILLGRHDVVLLDDLTRLTREPFRMMEIRQRLRAAGVSSVVTRADFAAPQKPGRRPPTSTDQLLDLMEVMHAAEREAQRALTRARRAAARARREEQR